MKDRISVTAIRADLQSLGGRPPPGDGLKTVQQFHYRCKHGWANANECPRLTEQWYHLFWCF